MSVPSTEAEVEWPPDLLALFTAKRVEMVRLAYLVAGSVAVAEELVQEAFLRLHQHWDGVENPAGYLRTTVVNLARGHLRRREVEQRHASIRLAADRVTGDPEIDDTWAAVCRLPPKQRAALALRFYEDLPEAEIAQILGCRVGTVKSNLHRGLARLRKELT